MIVDLSLEFIDLKLTYNCLFKVVWLWWLPPTHLVFLLSFWINYFLKLKSFGYISFKH